ncbi:MAG TPA: Gfo/Idh/MocA family oxidoreductase [Chitinophagaceae bacterium]|nr:Gfo/Idh/MocA family oxidoreductase [Chitinophagaceae bacterium]
MNSRRKFIKQLGAASLIAPITSYASVSEEEIEKRIIPYERKVRAVDEINVGIIGFGIMGSRNAKTILEVPGVKLVAVCDLYKGRLERAIELYGQQLFTTQSYEELLTRSDIDAVVVCTSDQWHEKISIDAMRKRKAVYCEKPVVHQLNQGWNVINVQKQTGVVLQVGSQRVSSIAYAEAKKFYKAGEIGQLNCIEASFDRHTALGAWQYTMPLDATTETIAWKKYLKTNDDTPFDAKRFFWWRNYKEYGTGVAGDLFVHLLSGIHYLTDSKGPSKIFATGDLSYWKDGRNVPDVMTGVMEYKACNEHPAFQVLLKVNLASGAEKVESGKVKFYGTEGVIDFGWNDFTITKNKFSVAPNIGGWDALDTYPEKMQQEILNEYSKKYSGSEISPTNEKPIQFAAPAGYDDRYDHFVNFFDSVRNKKPVVEDASFGFRAAAPCLACNESYFQKKVINWDPIKMKLS